MNTSARFSGVNGDGVSGFATEGVGGSRAVVCSWATGAVWHSAGSAAAITRTMNSRCAVVTAHLLALFKHIQESAEQTLFSFFWLGLFLRFLGLHGRTGGNWPSRLDFRLDDRFGLTLRRGRLPPSDLRRGEHPAAMEAARFLRLGTRQKRLQL